MANVGPAPIKYSFIANSDFTTAQYKFVKLTAANTVDLCAATTDKPIGVLQNNPAAQGTAEVMITGITKVIGAAALAAGAQIATNGSALAAAVVAGTDTTRYVVGTVLDATAAANGLATAAIDCTSPNRAA